MKRPTVLGLNLSHNASACIVDGVETLVAIQEERLTRRKYDRFAGAGPSLCIPYCLNAAGLSIADLDGVAVCVQGDASLPEFDVSSNPALSGLRVGVPIRYYGHHLSHAMSAAACSGYGDAAVIVADGLGSPVRNLALDESQVMVGVAEDRWEALSLYDYTPQGLRPLLKDSAAPAGWLVPSPDGGMPSFGSLGGMYAAVSQYIFGEVLDAGKVMGLAAYGASTFPASSFYDFDCNRMIFKDDIPRKFKRREIASITTKEKNLATSVQRALELALLEWIAILRDQSDSTRFCFAGGVALNGLANERIVAARRFRQHFFMPAADDSGVALGAAFLLCRDLGECKPRRLLTDSLGRIYGPSEIQHAVTIVEGLTTEWTPEWVDRSVDALIAGEVLGIFDAGSEFGPRALGQRSIIAAATDASARERVNSRVKHREPFRPFAPAVLAECADEWFDFSSGDTTSPFMLRVVNALEQCRSIAPAIVHVDGTARVQTVDESRPMLHRILREYASRTGIPILLNTSFNVAGEPIVETPADALSALLETDIDACVFAGAITRRVATIKSPLDMFPVLRIKEFVVEVRFPDVLASAKASKSLRFTNATEYGPIHSTASANLLGLLECCDGARDGWEILESLTPKMPALHAEKLANLLSKLRRLGAITYRFQRVAA